MAVMLAEMSGDEGTVMNRLRPWMIPGSNLYRGLGAGDGPVALVELGSTDAIPDPADICLPPFPVIGIGKTAHPLADRLDAIVETPEAATGIVRSILANPRAAAVTAGLLRLLPGMEPHAALEMESLAYGLLQVSREHADWLARGPYTGQAASRVLLDRRDGLLDIILDTSSGGAIDRKVRDDLYEALSLGALDDSISRVVLRAQGRTFSMGADLSEFGTTRDGATAHLIRSRTLPARMAAQCSSKLEVFIHGACGGAGLELAAWGARIVASPKAWFHLPELAMGILPGAGGCVSLTRRIGRQRTVQMILSGRRIPARTALDWGLVDALATDPYCPDIS